MAQAADLAALDSLGPVLGRIAGQPISLCWNPAVGGFYTVDLYGDGAAVGIGDTPSAAFRQAVGKQEARAALTAITEGFAVDA